jgi:hypothetical protein
MAPPLVSASRGADALDQSVGIARRRDAGVIPIPTDTNKA